jgi:hypothetical protein
VKDYCFFIEAFGHPCTWQIRKSPQGTKTQALPNSDQVFSSECTQRLATTVKIAVTNCDHYSFLCGEFGTKEALGDTKLPRHPHNITKCASHCIKHRLVPTHKTTRSTNRHHEEPPTDYFCKGAED